MNATLETTFTVTLNGLIAAVEGIVRIQPTDAGRAYVACCKAEEEMIDACGSVQEGAPLTALDAVSHRAAVALADFREATGTDFYHCAD